MERHQHVVLQQWIGPRSVESRRGRELSERVGVTIANLSILKTGKAKAIRFSTLEAICKELSCQPGDILFFEEEG